MKKFLSVLMVLAMLLAPMAISASAADYEFSLTSAEASRGDEVTIEVYLDKNSGLWATQFYIVYDPAYFDLVSTKNGDIFPGKMVMESEINDSGRHSYYGEASGLANLPKNPTGLLMTLTFKVLKTAPAGVHYIELYYLDNGEGWIVDATDMDKKISYAVTQQGTIKVNAPADDTTVDTSVGTDKGDETTDSTTDKADPDTDIETFIPPIGVFPDTQAPTGSGDKEDTKAEDTTAKAPQQQTAAPVTDADGSTVEETTSLGEIIVNPEETSPDKEYVTEYVTDEHESLVLDVEGKPQIGYREVIRGGNENNGGVNAIVYVIAGVLVVVAVAVVTTVIVVNQKKKK